LFHALHQKARLHVALPVVEVMADALMRAMAGSVVLIHGFPAGVEAFNYAIAQKVDPAFLNLSPYCGKELKLWKLRKESEHDVRVHYMFPSCSWSSL